MLFPLPPEDNLILVLVLIIEAFTLNVRGFKTESIDKSEVSFSEETASQLALPVVVISEFSLTMMQLSTFDKVEEVIFTRMISKCHLYSYST